MLFTTIQNNLVKKSHILFCMQTLLLPISIKFVEYFSLTSILTFNFLLNFIHKTFKLTKTEVNTKYTTNLPNYERFTNNKCSCVRLYEWSFFYCIQCTYKPTQLINYVTSICKVDAHSLLFPLDGWNNFLLIIVNSYLKNPNFLNYWNLWYSNSLLIDTWCETYL